MPYKTIATAYGLARLAAAAIAGIPLNLTHMAVGDGGGADVTPVEGMTALTNERYRAAINSVAQDPANPQRWFAELFIPAATGGWTIREFAVFDDAGGMVYVGNYPATYKTVPGDGATSELIIVADLIAANAGVISIVLDPATTIASRAWVTNNITRATLLPGGTTHQVLRKVTNADGDTEWADPTTATVLVNTVEETQTAAAAQATFTLTTVTTFGLGVFKDGVRVPRIAGAAGWQEGVDNTRVVLGTACSGGERITFLQNEPAASIPNPLDASLNLSDVENAATARANLGVYSKAETDERNPAGNIAFTARLTAPAGWLAANGAAVSRAVYATLFAAIGTTYGAGDGSTTFNLPDLRGEFIRGVDSGRGVDPGRAQGSLQAGAIQSHSHNVQADNGGFGTNASNVVSGTDRSVQYLAATSATGGTETRPRNIALLAIIKF